MTRALDSCSISQAACPKKIPSIPCDVEYGTNSEQREGGGGGAGGSSRHETEAGLHDPEALVRCTNVSNIGFANEANHILG